MKKYLFIILSICIGSALVAQTEYDALRIGQTDISGTARYMGMGGAFGALGGDASALKDNPGGLGVFRSGEMSATLSGVFQSTNSVWYNEKAALSSGLNLKFNHLAYIISIPLWQERSSGLLQSNFSFTFNRLKNFNRATKATGTTGASLTDFAAGLTNGFTEQALKETSDYFPYDNTELPWISTLIYNGYLMEESPAGSKKWKTSLPGRPQTASIIEETGGISEYAFGWGGNFNNNLFVGANLNLVDLSYTLTSVLDERFADGSFRLNNRLTQAGMGVNLKLGAIYLPTNDLRLGVAFHTPTFYSIAETGYARLDYTNQLVNKSGWTGVPQKGSYQNFNLQTPLQAQLSAAYLFGRKGLISVEYDFVNYTGMRFSHADKGRAPFQPENEGMKKVLQNGHVLKVGGEFKPSANVALRAGYALMTSGNNPNYTDGKALRINTVNTNTEYFEQKANSYFSAGIGYREAAWFVDLSYGLRMLNEDFYPYQFNRNDLQAADIKSNTSNIALTVGFKM